MLWKIQDGRKSSVQAFPAAAALTFTPGHTVQYGDDGWKATQLYNFTIQAAHSNTFLKEQIAFVLKQLHRSVAF